MRIWKAAVLAAALIVAAGAGAAVMPAARAQTRIVRAQAPRAFEILNGGSQIGIAVRDVEDGDSKTAKGPSAGALVDDVTADSPAEKAGVRKGDVIVEFDGERVRSARQLTRLVEETPAGRTVPMAVTRDGQRTTLSITPREGTRFGFERLEDLAGWGRDLRYRVAPRAFPAPPAPPAPPAAPRPPDPPSVWGLDDLLGRTNRLGITVDRLSSQLADYFGTKEGVLVSSVSDGSAASKAGVKAGDVITAINGTAVNDPSDVRREVQRMDDGEDFSISVMRDRKAVTLKGKAERPERRRPVRTSIL